MVTLTDLCSTLTVCRQDGCCPLLPLSLAAVARTGRSCIVHAAATASGPLGTGQPGTASRVKVAIKGGEASELECHIEGLLRQRGAPGGGEG